MPAILVSIVVLAAIMTPRTLRAQMPGTDTLLLRRDDLASRLAAGPELIRSRLEVARARAARLGTSFFPSRPELETSLRTDAPFVAEGEQGWEIGISQEIEIGGQYFLRRDAADAAIERAELEARAVELDLLAEARRAHARLAAATERVRLADTLLGFSRRLDTVAARMLAAEEISELDRNAVAIERERGEIERLQAGTDVAEARSELGRLLGLPLGTVIVIASDESPEDPERNAAAAREVEMALRAGNDSALYRRPDWKALDRDADRLRAERSLAARRWLPSIRLGAGIAGETAVFDRENLTGASDVVANGFGTLRSDDRLLALRLDVGIPLPIGGLYDLGGGDVALADAELTALDAQRRGLAVRIRADVAIAATRLTAAADAYSIFTRRIAPLAARNLELLERGYREGELGAAQVIAQQEQFIRAGEAFIAARRAYSEALADFERAIAQ